MKAKNAFVKLFSKVSLAATLFAGAQLAQAQVLLSGPYSQDFDALPQGTSSTGFTNNVTLQGWYAMQNGTAATSIVGGNGGTTTTGLRSFGPTTGTTSDRALGGVKSTGNFHYGVHLTNVTGSQIQSFTIQYSVEQWRQPSGKPTAYIIFDYNKTIDINATTGWSTVANSDITWATGSGNATDTDGNSKRVVNSFTANIILNPGEEILFRWKDANTNGYYLALDDIQIIPNLSSTPAPATIYYSKATGNLNARATWGNNPDGSGSQPPSTNTFANATFIIANRTSTTLNASWASGSNSKVIVGDGVTFIIPSNYAYSGTMDVGNNATLQVDGSVPSLGLLANNSTVIFNGADVQDIPQRTYGNLTISGSGTKVLIGNTTVNGNLNISAADLIGSATDTLKLGSNATITETTSNYYKGTLLKQATISSTTVSKDFGGMGLTFNNVGGGNWGNVKVIRTTDAAVINPKDDSKESIKRSWHIVPDAQVGTAVNLTLNWLISEDNGQNYGTTPQAQPWKSTDNGLTWIPVGNLVNITTNGNMRTANVTTNSFSIWTLSGTNNPLPVELVSFAAKRTENGIVCNWKTAQELNNDFFTVERSLNGREFIEVGTVKGNGTTSQAAAYSFTDLLAPGEQTYYRLKQTDFNGAFEYSKIVAVNAAGKQEMAVTLYPNPTAGALYVEAQNLAAEPAQVTVLNAQGQVVKTFTTEPAALAQGMAIDLHDQANGVYIVKIATAREVKTLRVVKQ